MVKKFAVVAVMLVALFMVAGIGMAQDMTQKTETLTATTTTETKAIPVIVGNKICPVTGNAIAETDMGKNTVEFEGKVYSLCCPACPAEFNKDPKVYVAKVEAEMAKEAALAEAK